MAEILIIEDDETIRTNISFLLNKSGHKTIEAENGVKGFELAKKEIPDLIISETQLNGIDGFELREELSRDADTDSIPFVFLSIKSDYEDIRKGMLAGADDYLAKPFRAEDLLGVVKAQLSKRQKHLRKFNEIGGNILVNLQHELRTPLVPILGFSQLIQQKSYMFSLGEISEMAEKIHTSGNRLLELIEKFFAYSDLMMISKNELLVKKMSDHYVMNIKNSIYDYGYRIAAMFDRQSDLKFDLRDGCVCISEMNLQKLLNELLQNAFTYSIPGSEVVIATEAKEKDYMISITDHGIGMSCAQIKKLSVADDCLYANDKRSGLGMTIVKKIIDLYRGSINISSKTGNYTCVTITLSLKSGVKSNKTTSLLN